MTPDSENWLKIAKYDLDVAQSTFKNGYFLKVVENCHSSLEKLLKGILIEQTDSVPPKIHDLLKLVSLTVIENLQDDTVKLLDELNDLYISTRYPEDFDMLVEKMTEEKVHKILHRTKGVYKWLLSQIEKA